MKEEIIEDSLTDNEQKKEDSAECEEDDGIIVFPNPEKKNRFRLGIQEYMPMSSSRILLSGMPGSGKRNVILNIIHRMRPKPSVVHLVHCDPNTVEYDCLIDDGIDLIMYKPEDFPTLKNIEEPNDPTEDEQNEQYEDDENEEESSGEKNITNLQNPLVIIDEITTDQLGKQGTSRFERLVNHVATHRNTTVVCSIQSLVNIPAKTRRAFNHFALWRQADKAVDQMAATRAGIPYDMLRDLFGLCKTSHDFIWLDLDSNLDSPWRYRLNMISPISISPH